MRATPRGRSGGPSPSQRVLIMAPSGEAAGRSPPRAVVRPPWSCRACCLARPSVSRRSQNQSPTGLFDQHPWVRRRFFHCQPPASVPAAIKPRSAELGSGTDEMAPRRPPVLLSTPAVKRSVFVEPAPTPLPKLSMRSRQASPHGTSLDARAKIFAHHSNRSPCGSKPRGV